MLCRLMVFRLANGFSSVVVVSIIRVVVLSQLSKADITCGPPISNKTVLHTVLTHK